MNKKRFFDMILMGIRQFQDPYYQGFAAQLAFYFLLSLVPITIVLSQLLGLFSISLMALSHLIEQYVSGEVAAILKGLVSYSPSGTLNFALIVMALWASSKAQFSLMRITNYTFTSGKSTGSGYIRERLRAIKTIAFTMVTVVFSLIILVYGELILQIVAEIVKNTVGIDIEVSGFWLFIRWPVGFTLFFLMISYNYYVLPTERRPFREILPGSIFAAVAILTVTAVYTRYVSHVANYDIIYGSLASIVALMFWFYLLSWTLVLGVLFNKVWKETHH